MTCFALQICVSLYSQSLNSRRINTAVYCMLQRQRQRQKFYTESGFSLVTSFQALLQLAERSKTPEALNLTPCLSRNTNIALAITFNIVCTLDRREIDRSRRTRNCRLAGGGGGKPPVLCFACGWRGRKNPVRRRPKFICCVTVSI